MKIIVCIKQAPATSYPFIEVFCDPLNENKITWFYPHKLPVGEQLLISRYFGKRNFIENTEFEIKSFLKFIEMAEDFETICIRPEVREKVERAFEHSMLKELEGAHRPDYSLASLVFPRLLFDSFELQNDRSYAVIAAGYVVILAKHLAAPGKRAGQVLNCLPCILTEAFRHAVAEFSACSENFAFLQDGTGPKVCRHILVTQILK